MIKTIDIAWLAGILDGEGSFTYHTTPRLQVGMTDIDTIEKVRLLYKTDNKIRIINRENQKIIYCIDIYGNKAIQYMFTIYIFMSIRRKAQIRNVINKWKNALSSSQRPTKARMVRALMKIKNISNDEALSLINENIKEIIQ